MPISVRLTQAFEPIDSRTSRDDGWIEEARSARSNLITPSHLRLSLAHCSRFLQHVGARSGAQLCLGSIGESIYYRASIKAAEIVRCVLA